MVGVFAACLIPILLVPLVAGISILNVQRKTPLTIMAGVLTLKPVVLTPILMMLYWLDIGYNHAPILNVLPAMVITIVIIVAFRSLFFGYEVRGAAWLLLALDALRWLSTLGAFTPMDSPQGFLRFGIASIVMPTVFAVVALYIVVKEAERPQRKRKTADI